MPVQANKQKTNPNASRIDFHRGRTLRTLAQTYPSLFEAILEAVQNSIDSGAANVEIKINRSMRQIEIYDNGSGATRARFDKALASIGFSIKTRDKLGQFGLGLIAFLSKCASYTFTSGARNGKEGYLEWTFVPKDIVAQATDVYIPCEPAKLKHVPSSKAVRRSGEVWWRSCMKVHQYVEDRQISRVQSADALLQAIVEKYGVAMRRLDTSVLVHIVNDDGTEDKVSGKAKLFSGRKLPEVVISEPDCGKTSFVLYLARKGTFGYKGKISLGEMENDFRFPLTYFVKDAAAFLSQEAIELLSSGVFEGYILSERCKLHENRRSFVVNDAFVGLCVAIDQWYKEHGVEHMTEVREQRQSTRLQDLSLECLRNVQNVLGNDVFAHLVKDTIGTFRYGSIGDGHAAPANSNAGAEQQDTALSTTATGQPRESNGEGHSNAQPEKERQSHSPFTAVGPEGQKRTNVRGGSQGLQIDHVAMGLNGPPWVLESRNGKLFFNVENPEWIAASEAGDRVLLQFQEIGVVMALIHYALPPDSRQGLELAWIDMVPLIGHLFRSSPTFNLKARIKANKKK